MVYDADKAKQTTYTTDDIMTTILNLRKSKAAIQETNKVIQNVAALEIRVKANQVIGQACSHLQRTWHHRHHSCHQQHRRLLQI
jgi:hypothetical protein